MGLISELDAKEDYGIGQSYIIMMVRKVIRNA